MSKRSSRRRIRRETGSTDTTVFAISKLSYLAIPVMALMVLLLIALTYWLAWTILIPIATVWWINHVRTIVGPNGIVAVGTFGTTELPWDEIAGLQFPKWSAVRAVRKDESKVRLPAVGFSDMPYIAEASGGRIIDPFAAAYDAAKAV